MSDELIKRIREGYNNWDSGYKADGALLGEAADLIEQQAAKIAELEALSEPVAWLVTGGRTYVDRAFMAELHAIQSVSERKDGARIVPLYTAPVASGPRYDWSVSGMKQSETGNWVMAGSAEKTGE